MTNSAEKLVKQTIKVLAKTQDLDYEELKVDAKKLIKIARNYDETLLGLMEELLDLGNIGSPEEINEFSKEFELRYTRTLRYLTKPEEYPAICRSAIRQLPDGREYITIGTHANWHSNGQLAWKMEFDENGFQLNFEAFREDGSRIVH